jgi:NhaA family Na+:H+ antiporter
MEKNSGNNKLTGETKLSELFIEFFNSEKSGGLILVIITVISLILANSAWHESYNGLWKIMVAGDSLVHWINDGLMTLFFLLIGLELEREIYEGELSDPKNALLPVSGAIGGMLVPAGLYFLFNAGTSGISGYGIPMATDIAFAIGILSLLGNRVPTSLKVFLTALAIVDDLGAIIIIALFYTNSLSIVNLLIALGIFFVLIVLNRLKVKSLIPYIAGGVIMWYFMHHSGIHATISGILLAFAIPFTGEGRKSPSARIEHFLEKPVAYLILPLFAAANTCLTLTGNWQSGLAGNISVGIIAGLLAGKPLGIWLFSRIAVGFKIAALPPELRWKNIFSAGMLAGIGFTMSIFITLLAFKDENLVNTAKIAIIIASLAAGILGSLFLKLTLRKPVTD